MIPQMKRHKFPLRSCRISQARTQDVSTHSLSACLPGNFLDTDKITPTEFKPPWSRWLFHQKPVKVMIQTTWMKNPSSLSCSFLFCYRNWLLRGRNIFLVKVQHVVLLVHFKRLPTPFKIVPDKPGIKNCLTWHLFIYENNYCSTRTI